MPEMVFCRACGKEIHRTARSCPGCGVVQVAQGGKSKLVAAVLAIFLGGLGVHRFYLGQWRGLWYLLFCWTAIPGLIALVEGIVFLCTDDAKWDDKYNQGVPSQSGDSVALIIVAVFCAVMVLLWLLWLLCAIIFVPMLLEKDPAPLGDNVQVIIPPVDGTPPPQVPPLVVVEPSPPAGDTKPPPETPSANLPATVAFAKGTFAVQLAAFTDDKGVSTLVNKLKRAGYPAYSEPTNTARGMVWRVRVGPYKTRETAMTVRERLKKDGHDGMPVPAR